jgi:putative transposase
MVGLLPDEQSRSSPGIPMRENALANTLRGAHSDYARYANVKLRTSGHFWQNRYYSCPLDQIHQWDGARLRGTKARPSGNAERCEDYLAF